MFQIKKALKSNFLINLFSAKRSPVQQHRWSSCTLVLGHPVSDTIRRILFDSCTIVHDYTHRVHHRTRLIRFRSGASAIRAFKLKFSIRLIFQVHVIFVLSELGTALVTKSFISFDLHVTLFKWFFENFQPEESSVKTPQWGPLFHLCAPKDERFGSRVNRPEEIVRRMITMECAYWMFLSWPQ